MASPKIQHLSPSFNHLQWDLCFHLISSSFTFLTKSSFEDNLFIVSSDGSWTSSSFLSDLWISLILNLLHLPKVVIHPFLNFDFEHSLVASLKPAQPSTLRPFHHSFNRSGNFSTQNGMEMDPIYRNWSLIELDNDRRQASGELTDTLSNTIRTIQQRDQEPVQPRHNINLIHTLILILWLLNSNVY